MKELVPMTWCDLHMSENGEKVTAEGTFTVRFGGRWYEADVCASHQTGKHSLTDWFEIIVEQGHQPDMQPVPRSVQHKPRVSKPNPKADPDHPLTGTKKDPAVCEFCGSTYTAGSGMALHVKGKHPDLYDQYVKDNGIRTGQYVKKADREAS